MASRYGPETYAYGEAGGVVFAVLHKERCVICKREKISNTYFFGAFDVFDKYPPQGGKFIEKHLASEFSADGVYCVFLGEAVGIPYQNVFCIKTYKIGDNRLNLYVGIFPNNFRLNPTDSWSVDMRGGEVIASYTDTTQASRIYDQVVHEHEKGDAIRNFPNTDVVFVPKAPPSSQPIPFQGGLGKSPSAKRLIELDHGYIWQDPNPPRHVEVDHGYVWHDPNAPRRIDLDHGTIMEDPNRPRWTEVDHGWVPWEPPKPPTPHE